MKRFCLPYEVILYLIWAWVNLQIAYFRCSILLSPFSIAYKKNLFAKLGILLCGLITLTSIFGTLLLVEPVCEKSKYNNTGKR